MKLTRRDFAAGLAVGITAPYVSGSARAQGASIKIGMCVPVRGPAAEQGLGAQNGAKMVLAAVNKGGGVLGKQVELVIEDDQTTNPGIVLAFSKLAAQSDIVGFLGSIRSTQVHAMAPDVLKLGKPVMIGGTDPTLTHMGNQWLFRFRPNDSYSGRVIADYGVNTLGKKTWAIVHSTTPFRTPPRHAPPLALVCRDHPGCGDQQGRLDRSRQNPRGDPCHPENGRCGRRIQFRSERRRSARLQRREEREGDDRLRQAHRLQRLIALPALPDAEGPAAFSIRSSMRRAIPALPSAIKNPPGEFASRNRLAASLNRAFPWISHFNCCSPV